MVKIKMLAKKRDRDSIPDIMVDSGVHNSQLTKGIGTSWASPNCKETYGDLTTETSS